MLPSCPGTLHPSTPPLLLSCSPDNMAEEDPQQQSNTPEPGVRSLAGLLPGLQGSEAGALQLRIRNSICKSVQSKVENILQDVEKFSDIEKLYLYLKLPSGPSTTADKSDQSAVSSSRTQQMHAYSWIHNHLEEHPETSLPKQEVYDEYKSFCDNLNYHPLSAADFGKMMKNVFPNMKARRLGMRGKSKYCYSGLRKRPFVHTPSLPALDLHKTGDGLQCDGLESSGQLGSIKEDVRQAACELVCEWAQKVLKRQFDAVEDLARFLVDSHYINNKSLAALAVTTGAATDVTAPQPLSAFVPTAEAHSFQPHVTTLSSPSVDAKQQLQRKIQRKQQEQKRQSPVPGDALSKRPDEAMLCPSPAAQSPQPTIGIVVAAVPSPITVQRSRPLMSPSPLGAVENKVLPINIQMVTQPVQAVKQSQKTPQNILVSPLGERTARQRYPQILPKPSATTAITLCSPSTMIIGNSPIKTVVTTCHMSPVSLVKMTAISLPPNTTTTATSLPSAALRPASAGVSGAAAPDDVSSRSTSAAPGLAPAATSGQPATSTAVDVEMEVEAIHKNSQMQNPSSLTLSHGAAGTRASGDVQRAASVPIPQTRGFLGLEETTSSNCNGTSSSGASAGPGSSSSNGTQNSSTLLPAPSGQRGVGVSFRTSSFGESSSVAAAKESFLSRKRSGLSPDLSPIKRAFIPQQATEGAAGFGYEMRSTVPSNVPRPGAPARPESAPASREVEMTISPEVHALCAPSFRASGFHSVAKTQSPMQRRNTPTVMESSGSLSHAAMQPQQLTSISNPNLQQHADGGDAKSSASDGAQQQQSYSANEPLDFFTQAPSSGPLPMQTDADYYSFDDDVTQDSIVEELMNNLQEFGSCANLPGQQPAMQESIMAGSQPMTTFYHNPIHTPTPTPTPTPTSEMLGGASGLTRESPCSRMASTTPVDSALGSSRHTPVGTPHSNCSSNVPPSPVECRNPFAFTPINSSITGFHDGSTVSSSPVKPMQRPMATHPDKTRLEWMSNSYSNNSGGGGGSLSKSSGGMGLVPSYQGLIGDHFQKPHAFAVPHARHFGRLTPISPVQQQVASMNKQEGFAVPAPLDSKGGGGAPAAGSRCRSVSPAVHQRNLGTNNMPYIPRSVVSPFNSPVTPEVLNIFANSQQGLGVGSLAQRSHSVPLNVMMQTEVPQCSGSSISNVLRSKMDGDLDDSARGLGINNVPSSYTARMNLTQILESDPSLGLLASDPGSGGCKLQRPGSLMENSLNEQMLGCDGPQQQQQQQQLDFGSTVKDLLTDGSSQLMEQVSAADFNDLNALDTNLLFDPSQQQGQYQSAAAEELANQALFEQMTSEATHAGGLDWLESKDHPTVGLMG